MSCQFSRGQASFHNVQLCLSCRQIPFTCKCQSKQQFSESAAQMEELTKKYADILQRELSELSHRKEEEIEELSQEVSKLKTEISKLERRNKLDRQSENQLNEVVRRQSQRISELQNVVAILEASRPKQVVREVVVKEIVKDLNQNEEMAQQNARLRDQLSKALNELSQKQREYTNRINQLLSDAEAASRRIKGLSDHILKLEELVLKNNNSLQNLQKDKQYLEEKIKIYTQPVTSVKIEPVVLHKVSQEPPQIHTVYVDRPIIKTEFVEVEKIVKQFVKPDRPFVTRVINCGPQKKCRCQSPEDPKQITATEDANEIHEAYREVISNYKQQRQKLVNCIRDRDSDYYYLKKQMELNERMHRPSQNYRKCDPTVEVTVHRDETEGESEEGKHKKTNVKAQHTKLKGGKR